MNLIDLISASSGLGVALSLSMLGYDVFGIIGVIVGIPIGYLIGFYIMSLFFMGISFIVLWIDKFTKYGKSK